MDKLQIYREPELAILENKQKIREYSEVDFNTRCANLVYYLLNLLGVSDGKTEHHTTLVEFVKATAGHYTFEEIDKAFKLYVSNQLSNIKVFQQLNSVVFGNVMKAYDNYKIEKLRAYRQQLPQQAELSKSEIEEIMDKACLNAFNEIKETGDIEGITHHIYDHLDKKGLINATNKHKKEVYAQAKKEVLAKTATQKVESVIQHKEIKSQIEKIKTDQSNEVKNLAKDFVLKEFFLNLINNKKELEL